MKIISEYDGNAILTSTPRFAAANNFNNKIEGKVIDINLRSTELEYKDTKIIVPNDFVYSSAVTVKKQKINN